MRGEAAKQSSMLSLIGPEQRVPQDHPIRKTKAMADEVFARLSPTFEEPDLNRNQERVPRT